MKNTPKLMQMILGILLITGSVQAYTITTPSVNTGDTLTALLWNQVVDDLNGINGSVGGFSGTAGSIPFAGVAGTLGEDNTNLFWDGTNNRLGIGTASPERLLTIGKEGFLGSSASPQIKVKGVDPQIEFSGGASGNASMLGRSGTDFILDWFGVRALTIADNGTGVDWQAGLGDPTPDGSLRLDVEGAIGATEYCDANGSNCKAAADIGLPTCTDGETVVYNGTTSDWECGPAFEAGDIGTNQVFNYVTNQHTALNVISDLQIQEWGGAEVTVQNSGSLVVQTVATTTTDQLSQPWTNWRFRVLKNGVLQHVGLQVVTATNNGGPATNTGSWATPAFSVQAGDVIKLEHQVVGYTGNTVNSGVTTFAWLP